MYNTIFLSLSVCRFVGLPYSGVKFWGSFCCNDSSSHGGDTASGLFDVESPAVVFLNGRNMFIKDISVGR